MSYEAKFECGGLCIFADEIRDSMKQKCSRCAAGRGLCLVKIISEVIAVHQLEALSESPGGDGGETIH